MYIVRRGVLSVVDDDGVRVFVKLNEGSVFGEVYVIYVAAFPINHICAWANTPLT
jgi:signal-transduction protein with cAMP-binding, CBS, and nucleotidyltransferase domain